MRRTGILSVLVVLLVFVSTSLCFAAVIEGGGRQSRGYPGHNAELYGQVFELPRAGTIAGVAGEGADGFWIETEAGALVRSFNSLNQGVGFTLRAGRYRVLPNLRDNPKADRSWVRITVNCP